jgi:hypothetical protein
VVNWRSVQKREAAQAPAVRVEQGGPRPHLGHSEVGRRLVPGQSRTTSSRIFSLVILLLPLALLNLITISCLSSDL